MQVNWSQNNSSQISQEYNSAESNSVDSEELFLFDIPLHLLVPQYRPEVLKDVVNLSLRGITRDVEETSNIEKDAKSHTQPNPAVACTSEGTYRITKTEHSSTLLLGPVLHNSGENISLTVWWSPNSSFAASLERIRPDFSVIYSMIQNCPYYELTQDQSTFPALASDLSYKTARAVSKGPEVQRGGYTPEKYYAAASASRQEIKNELLREGLRLFSSDTLQRLHPRVLDEVIDAMIAQLSAARMQPPYEELDGRIDRVPLYVAVDALQEIFPLKVLQFVAERFGMYRRIHVDERHIIIPKRLEKKSFLVGLHLCLRSYIQHKTALILQDGAVPLNDEKLLEALKSSLHPDIALCVAQGSGVDPSSESTQHCKSGGVLTLFDTLDEILGGIAVRTLEPSVAECEQNTNSESPLTWQYCYPDHLPKDSALHMLQTLFQLRSRWSKREILPFLLPVFRPSCSIPIEDLNGISNTIDTQVSFEHSPNIPMILFDKETENLDHPTPHPYAWRSDSETRNYPDPAFPLLFLCTRSFAYQSFANSAASIEKVFEDFMVRHAEKEYLNGDIFYRSRK